MSVEIRPRRWGKATERAEAAEAEVRALREGIEALADEWDLTLTPPRLRYEVAAKQLRALLASSPAATTGEADRHNHMTRDVKTLGQCPACDRATGEAIREANTQSDREDYAAWLASPQRYGTMPRVREQAFLAGFAAARTPAPVSSGEARTGEAVQS